MTSDLIGGEHGVRPMRILVVDDEPLALADTLACVGEADPSAVARGLSSPMEALAWATEHECDLALLDIEMPGMTGLELVLGLAESRPSIRVVFVTSYDQYALDAFGVHAQGYLLKPVDVDALGREIKIAREYRDARAVDLAATADEPQPPLEEKVMANANEPHVRLRVTCFGGFEVYAGDRRLAFRRRRAKELLAMLIDRRGTGVSVRDGAANLWPDAPYDNSKRSYYQSIVRSLREVLDEVGAGDVLVKSWNNLAVNPKLIDCDLYRALDGDASAMAAFHHNYLPSYEWSEETSAILDRMLYEGVR